MQQGLGMSPSRAAIGFLLLSLAEIAGAWLAMAVIARRQRHVPQCGALIAALALVAFRLLATTYGTGLSMTAMALPVLALGLGLGMIGAPLTDLTMGSVEDADAGSASGLFNTAIHLGIALGVVCTGVVFFSHDQSATARGTDVVDAFSSTLPYVIGGFPAMWALMLLLPRPVSARAQRG